MTSIDHNDKESSAQPNADSTHGPPGDSPSPMQPLIGGTVGPQAQSQRGKQHRYRKFRKAPMWIEAACAVALVGITGFYTHFAKQQRDAMLTSNEISRTTSRDSERAYVFYSATEALVGRGAETGKQSWFFTPMLENGGNTPALEVRDVMNQNLDHKALPDDFDYPDYPRTSGAFPNLSLEEVTFIIGPHGKKAAGGLAIPADVLQRVNEKGTDTHVCFWGWVSYKDIFGCGHKTEFCEEVVALKGQHFVMSNCAKHNCADKDCKDYQPTNKPICLQ